MVKFEMQARRERNAIPDRLFLPLRFTISVSDRLILLPSLEVPSREVGLTRVEMLPKYIARK